MLLTSRFARNPVNYFRFICIVQRAIQKYATTNYTTTSADATDLLTTEILQRQRNKASLFPGNDFGIRYFMGLESDPTKNIPDLTTEELDSVILQSVSKNRDKELTDIILQCLEIRKFINEITVKKLYRDLSSLGKPDMVVMLQKYTLKVNPNLHRRHGEFLHYLAKAHCFKGNSEKGLALLKDTYKKYVSLRSFYRIILRELIQDTVLNRSEASLVIFKKNVIEFSTKWGDHYPLICLWHICWMSTWFSDQMLSNELLEVSENLREIVRDRAASFSITVLKEEYNEDAVLRLLQSLLKYDMMAEYVKVLQVLFNYKLRNRDIRGCTEILRNCAALGVTLPSNQQGRYIKMLIDNNQPDDGEPPHKPESKNIKFKF